jgi:hypothetical protein
MQQWIRAQAQGGQVITQCSRSISMLLKYTRQGLVSFDVGFKFQRRLVLLHSFADSPLTFIECSKSPPQVVPPRVVP